MNITIHDVKDIIIEDARSAGGATWRKIKIKGHGGIHEVVLFAASDGAENLELTLGETQ